MRLLLHYVDPRLHRRRIALDRRNGPGEFGDQSILRGAREDGLSARTKLTGGTISPPVNFLQYALDHDLEAVTPVRIQQHQVQAFERGVVSCPMPSRTRFIIAVVMQGPMGVLPTPARSGIGMTIRSGFRGSAVTPKPV
jgi:hypothetical protein